MKEIPYDIKPISLIKSGGEQHCNEYREVNPMEQVPALQIGKVLVHPNIQTHTQIINRNELIDRLNFIKFRWSHTC